MHQDNPFYAHTNGQYVDVLVHLDDTFHENGEIRFLAGSHKLGALEHVTRMPDGTPCSPHLPTDQYALEDTVPVPAKRGDVVLVQHLHDSRLVHQQHTTAAPSDPRGLPRPEEHADRGAKLRTPRLDGARLPRAPRGSGVVRNRGLAPLQGELGSNALSTVSEAAWRGHDRKVG